MSQSQRRRRDILLGLGGAAVVTFLLAVITGVGALWVLHLIADVLLVGYVILLVQIKNGALGGGRGAAARTIRAVPHRAPLAPVGARPVGSHRMVPRHSHLPAAYGATAPQSRVPALPARSA
jgi:hypothetical protein